MKSLFTLSFALVFSFCVTAQNVMTSQKYKIAFETPELLEQYETESETVIGFENNNYAVDIEIFPFSQKTKAFEEDQKIAAFVLAKQLGLKDSKEVTAVPNIVGAHYVLAYDNYDGNSIPVYVIAIINVKKRITYEVTVYCYNLNLIEGKKIANSFKLIE